jgi:4-amino-4-deoxy-L-arabinose transferase-like glycosyltransferase
LKQTGKLENRDKLLFGLIFAGLLLRLVLSPPIWLHGEAREGLVVQGIVHAHQWILPYRNGEVPSKPPLFHWIAALAALLIGVNDFTVRLPSAIGAEIIVIATFLLGRSVGGRRAGWLAVGALLGMYEFWDAAAQARVDMVFTACVTVAIAGFIFWYREGNNSARATCYIATACAVLAKGPAGMVLPGVVIVAFLIAERRLRRLGDLWSWPLALLVVVIDVGWYALAYHIGGNEFLQVQIQRENLDRALGSGEFMEHKTFLVTAGWLVTRTLPWNLALLWSLIRRWHGQREDSTGRLLHVWWSSVMVVFALAAGKRAVYLLPLYPAIAVLAARSLLEIIPGWARSTEIKGVAPMAPVSGGTPGYHLTAGKAIGVGMVALDLAVMLVNHNVWRSAKSRRARLAFSEKVSKIVPPQAALFAAADFDNNNLIVMAYRLGRGLERKTLICADRKDYFLLPLELKDQAAVEVKIMASSEIDRVSLVTMLSENPASNDVNCKMKSPRVVCQGDTQCAN